MFLLAALLQVQAFRTISIFHKLDVEITVIMKTDLEIVHRLVHCRYYGYVKMWKSLPTVVDVDVVIPLMPPVFSASWVKGSD